MASTFRMPGQSLDPEGYAQRRSGPALNSAHLFMDAPSYVTGGMSSYVVATSDFNGDGKPDVVTANYGSDTVSVLLGNGDGTFGSPSTFATGSGSRFVAVGDFNGDGNVDLVTADYSSSTVSILLGNGDGTFQSHVDYPTGEYPVSVAVADFNGDGRSDLVTADFGGNAVSVLLGNGDGTFQTHIEYATADYPFSVIVGDFNGDGHPDLATADNFNSISVLLGKGDGTFQAHVDYAAENFPDAIAVGDFNGDGRLDLAVTNECGKDSTCGSESPGTVSIFLGDGDGTFQPQVAFNTGQKPYSIAAGKFNGDGKLDLVTSNAFDDVSILLGKGNGAFNAPVEYGAGSIPSSVVVADLTSDGNADLVTADRSGNAVTVLLGNGDGSFRSRMEFNAPGSPQSVATADFNHDGNLDLAVVEECGVTPSCQGTGGVGILLGTGHGAFQSQIFQPTGYQPYSVVAGDFNGDGNIDLAVANSCVYSSSCEGNVSILLGNGDGTFQPPMNYATGIHPVYVTAVDFTGNGTLDLAVVNQCGSDGTCDSPGSVSILLGNGDGTFRTFGSYGAGDRPSSLAVGDFSGTGKLDVAVANTCGSQPLCNGLGSISVLMGNGDGTFQTAANYSTQGYGSSSIAAGDLNGDGVLDLVTADSGSNSLSVFLGSGNGTFQVPVKYALGGQFPSWVTITDLNGDGKPDLAVADAGVDGAGEALSVLLGKGNGTFQPHVEFGTGNEPASIAPGDFNGDGQMDLAVANQGGGTVSIFLNAAGTNVTLSSSANPSTRGEAVTFNVTLTPSVEGAGVPTGSVTFLSGSKKATVIVANGVAALTTSKLAVGSYPIAAHYSGDSNFNPNTSNSITQVVNQ